MDTEQAFWLKRRMSGRNGSACRRTTDVPYGPGERIERGVRVDVIAHNDAPVDKYRQTHSSSNVTLRCCAAVVE